MRSRTAGVAVTLAAALVGGLAGGLLPGVGQPPTARAVTAVASASPAPTTSPTASTTAEPVAAPADKTPAVSESAGRLVVASVGIDLAIEEEIAPVDGVVSPSTRTGAARVLDLAVNQAATVVALHSSLSEAPGNALSTTDGESTVMVGDAIEADGVSYVTVSAQVLAKGEDAWGVLAARLGEDDTLVVVTCRPTSASPAHSSANVVIVARRT